MADRIRKGTQVEYPGSVIATGFKLRECDYLLTTNEKHFDLPEMRDKVYTPGKFLQEILKA